MVYLDSGFHSGNKATSNRQTERLKTAWWHTDVWQADSDNATRTFSMPKAISYHDTMVKVASLASILSAKWTSNTVSFKLFACPCALVPLCIGGFSSRDSTNFSPISIVATKINPALEIVNESSLTIVIWQTHSRSRYLPVTVWAPIW